jgi:hypothetical protein
VPVTRFATYWQGRIPLNSNANVIRTCTETLPTFSAPSKVSQQRGVLISTIARKNIRLERKQNEQRQTKESQGTNSAVSTSKAFEYSSLQGETLIVRTQAREQQICYSSTFCCSAHAASPKRPCDGAKPYTLNPSHRQAATASVGWSPAANWLWYLVLNKPLQPNAPTLDAVACPRLAVLP